MIPNGVHMVNVHDLAQLFERDEKMIRKHINNVLKEKCNNSTVAKFATVQNEDNRQVTKGMILKKKD